MQQTRIYLFAIALACAACQQERKDPDEGSLAETHPKLEKQLAQDTANRSGVMRSNDELYEHYRITTEEYQKSGDYAAGSMYRGLLSQLDEKSHSGAKTYRTALKEGLKQGINFAGKYTVVTVGCGTSCQKHYVVDRENGKVLDEIQSSYGAKYSADSRLFIVNPPDSAINYNECNNCTPVAYTFENGKFRKVSQE